MSPVRARRLLTYGGGILLVLGALSYAARALIIGVGVVMVLGGVLIGAGGAKRHYY